MTKVCVGVVVGEFMRAPTVATLLDLAKNEKRIATFIIKQGVLVHINRDDTVIDALKTDCTHLFFVDSDVVFASFVLDRLLKQDKDIIGANYNMRSLPPRPTVRMLIDGQPCIVPMDELPKETFECHSLPGGCTLIKLDVFRKLSRPWFHFGEHTEEKKGEGEDLWFCKKAKEAGYKIWCDPTLVVKHIGEYLY